MDRTKIAKYAGGGALLIGLLLLGRVLSEGNPDTGKLLSPVIVIVLGAVGLFAKPKAK